ncbi:nSTAND1 domain-containing NTPase [Massilia sp. S19_KUP03_FR1]|uniref:nSTAND1 domain-containing NTPase n=1 Tax=Massilia sp. S19_KUP03_FR1 TaxID=3025503 RepID=UPI002FCDA73E
MNTPFQFGEWQVDPLANAIESTAEKRQMEPRTMAVLVALCEARGALLSSDELLTQCWGSTLSGDSPLHKNIAQLRRLLGDSASSPRYIETVRMRGYRTVAPLDFSTGANGERKPWHAGSPFRGLLAYDAGHADVFFGRDEATRQLVDAANAQVASGLALLLVLGPSGSGKTSVVQAGLLPALAHAPASLPLSQPLSQPLRLAASTTFDLFDQGEQTLFTALAGALLDLQWEDQWAFSGANAVALGARLDTDPVGVAAQLAASLAQPGARFGIFIDRFEALFHARVDGAARTAFLHTLEILARSSAVLLVIACRNDFYPSIAQFPLLIEAKRHGGHIDLDPPGFADIAQMIRRPAAAARLSFESDPATGASLDDILCASAAGRPDALPLLAYCLQELYRLRTAEDVLGFDAFHQLGDLEGAIGQRAEQVVLALTEPQRAALGHIMSLVIILSNDGVSVSSQRVPWPALQNDDARQAVTKLIDARLFVSDLAGGAPVFGIAHDAILRRWPRMTGWIAAHRSALGARSRLAQHATRWCAEGRRADLLLPGGKLLDEALALQQAGAWSLTADEDALIVASQRRVRQRARARMAALALMIVLAVLAVVLGISAQLANRAEQLRRSEAEGLMDFMLGDFADKLRPLGRLDLLESVSGKALQYLSGSDGADLSPAALTLRAKGLQTISEVSRAQGNPAEALDALRQAHGILMRQLQRAPTDLQVLKNLGANAYWVAQIYQDQSNWAAAEVAARDYLRYADRLHQLEPDNPEWWIEQSYAHNNLGALAQAHEQPARAAPFFATSIALKQRALALTPAASWSSVAAALADSYSWLASAREALGELAAAEQLYAQELALVMALRERFPTESLWIYREVNALQHRASSGVALGLDTRAVQDYDTAQRLFAPLVEQDPKNQVWQVELAGLEQDRLRIIARTVDADSVLAPLARVHARFQTLLALDPKNVEWAQREAAAHLRMASVMPAGSAANQQSSQALAKLQVMLANNPSAMGVRLALIDGLIVRARIQQSRNDPSFVLSCRQAHGIIGNHYQNTNNYKILNLWVQINACLGQAKAAQAAITRLDEIGYRDTLYLKLIAKPVFGVADPRQPK